MPWSSLEEEDEGYLLKWKADAFVKCQTNRARA